MEFLTFLLFRLHSLQNAIHCYRLSFAEYKLEYLEDKLQKVLESEDD